MKLTQDEIGEINYGILDDSTKIIRYLEKSNKVQKKYNILTLFFTIIGAVGSIVASVTGIILLFQ